jgi:hypothetical protein
MAAAAGGFVDPVLEWKSTYSNEIERVPDKSIYMGVVQGMPVTPFCEKAQIEALQKEFIHREGDVWIVTYLKSGTTLTQDIIKHFVGKTATDNPLMASPWLEVSARVNMIAVPIAIANQIPAFEGRRFWKSHWWPRDHLARNGKSKFIYVARNGLDVCVSFFHHIKGFPLYEYSGDLNDFFEKFMDDGKSLDFGSWWHHVGEWWKRRNDPDVLFLFYEDMLADPKACVRKIADFAGYQASNDRIDEIVKATSFAEMKKRPIFYDMIRSKDASPFLRKGVAGDGKHTFSSEQIKRFEDKCKAYFVGDLADYPWQK